MSELEAYLADSLNGTPPGAITLDEVLQALLLDLTEIYLRLSDIENDLYAFKYFEHSLNPERTKDILRGSIPTDRPDGSDPEPAS